MAEPIIIEADIPDALQDDFREALLKVPEQKNIGALVAFMFMAGVNAQRNAGVPRLDGEVSGQNHQGVDASGFGEGVGR